MHAPKMPPHWITINSITIMQYCNECNTIFFIRMWGMLDYFNDWFGGVLTSSSSNPITDWIVKQLLITQLTKPDTNHTNHRRMGASAIPHWCNYPMLQINIHKWLVSFTHHVLCVFSFERLRIDTDSCYQCYCNAYIFFFRLSFFLYCPLVIELYAVGD